MEDREQERETLLLRSVQKGIDYYGVTQSAIFVWAMWNTYRNKADGIATDERRK